MKKCWLPISSRTATGRVHFILDPTPEGFGVCDSMEEGFNMLMKKARNGHYTAGDTYHRNQYLKEMKRRRR